MKPLIILGAGGFARETLDIVEAINSISPRWEMLGFIVDAQYGNAGQIVNDKPILGSFEELAHYPNAYVVCGVGSPQIRRHMIQRVQPYSVQFANLIHPSVIKTRWMHLGEGVVIAAGCVMSNALAIGDHVHLNPSCTIGHDVEIEAFVSLAPGVLISGNVHLEEGAYVGTGARVIEKKTVGTWSIVGAGSTVIKDVPPHTTVVGTPAKVIKERATDWYLHEN